MKQLNGGTHHRRKGVCLGESVPGSVHCGVRDSAMRRLTDPREPECMNCSPRRASSGDGVAKGDEKTLPSREGPAEIVETMAEDTDKPAETVEAVAEEADAVVQLEESVIVAVDWCEQTVDR